VEDIKDMRRKLIFYHVRPSVLSVTSKGSLNIEATELKFFNQISYFNTTKITNKIFEFLFRT